MKSCVIPAAIAAAVVAVVAPASAADDMVSFNGITAKPGKIIPGVGQVMIPASSIEQPGDAGLRMHTHYRVLKPVAAVMPPGLRPAGARPLLSEPETPASAACVYGLVTAVSGCDPNAVTQNASGGSRAIGIVDAFDDPTVIADLAYFSTAFGLPPANIQVVYCSKTTCDGVQTPPKANKGWALEIALDVEWAHAMAPSAQIILVEANSNSNGDLLRAEDKAAELVAAAGGGEVSNSWGGSEFTQQTKFDSHFVHDGVVFFASTGDHDGGTNSPDVEWPATSPNVIAVGGTTIVRRPNGAYRTQSAWIDTGGGLSTIYTTRPPFQDPVTAQVGNTRGVPDVAWDADPNSGGYVYCTVGCGNNKPGRFFIVGGTSLASPSIAGMTNNAGHFRISGDAEHAALYANLGKPRFTDIISGECGNGRRGKFVNAVTGWDLCTGIGAPRNAKGL